MVDVVRALVGEEECEGGVLSKSRTSSKVRGRAARRNAFSFANASSIGLKSGL